MQQAYCPYCVELHMMSPGVDMCRPIPIGSMYAIYGNIHHQNTPNVSIYTIHGSVMGYKLHRFTAILQLTSSKPGSPQLSSMPSSAHSFSGPHLVNQRFYGSRFGSPSIVYDMVMFCAEIYIVPGLVNENNYRKSITGEYAGKSSNTPALDQGVLSIFL